jgi:hypothetical protein
VFKTVSRVTPAGRLGRADVGGAVAEPACAAEGVGTGVDEDAGVDEGVAMADAAAPEASLAGVTVGVVEAVVAAGEAGDSVGVAVITGSSCGVGAASATPASPLSRPKPVGNANATSPASRTNARRVIRRASLRIVLVVRRITA